MERLASIFLLSLVFVVSVYQGLAHGAGTMPGIITAFNVDITADDGSLLADRLNVGDMVYIVINPPSKKKDWIRISRSPEDGVGIGWVERKNIREVSQYQGKSSAGYPAAQSEQTIDTSRSSSFDFDLELVPEEKLVEGLSLSTYSRIAVAPFKGIMASDHAEADKLYRIFLSTLQRKKAFNDQTTRIPVRRVTSDQRADLNHFVKSNNLDGIFIGTLSSPIGGSRLLEVKFFAQDQSRFVFEQTTQVPLSGNVSSAIEKLVDAAVTSLAPTR